jgi:hypothetical protein
VPVLSAKGLVPVPTAAGNALILLGALVLAFTAIATIQRDSIWNHHDCPTDDWDCRLPHCDS